MDFLTDLHNCDLLVLDDFLTTPVTAQTAAELLNIPAAREGRGSTLVTSQFDPPDWYKSLQNAVIAESILNAARELKELREQNTRLKRLLAEVALEKDALREVAKGRFRARPPSAAPWTCSSRSWACQSVWRAKLSGSPAPPTNASQSQQSPADPDAELRAWPRTYAKAHPCQGFRRAWAALRHDEHRVVNKKKVQRLWAELPVSLLAMRPGCALERSSFVRPHGKKCEGGAQRLAARLQAAVDLVAVRFVIIEPKADVTR